MQHKSENIVHGGCTKQQYKDHKCLVDIPVPQWIIMVNDLGWGNDNLSLYCIVLNKYNECQTHVKMPRDCAILGEINNQMQKAVM